jgi:parvulin-like peptidyl-prolyl isomerase
MKRFLLPILALLAALPLAAQQSTATGVAAIPPADRIVATINGESITSGELDQLYARLSTQMHDGYEQSGGKAAFLENYLRKRLILQEAEKANFDKRPDVQAELAAARESALFDRYIRDVVAAPIITEKAMRDYYDSHKTEFAVPEKFKVRHIVVTPIPGAAMNSTGSKAQNAEEAQAKIAKIQGELHVDPRMEAMSIDPKARQQAVLNAFAQKAMQYSEDASAPKGGDLGWVTKGQLDPTFEDAALNLQVGVVSGIIRTQFGYHLILLEARKPGGVAPFEASRARIREALMAQNAADVMASVTRLTNELRAQSKISIHPENITDESN